jgi:cytochrome c-type biogenesis protein CcmE
MEQDQLLSVDYTGTEAPPDTFKDDSQALADGSFGHDGVFHAKALQAKCASKYAPQQPGNQMRAEPVKSMTQAQPPPMGWGIRRLKFPTGVRAPASSALTLCLKA